MTSEAKQDQAVLYVLGGLAPEALEEFERAMSTDHELTEFVAELQESAADLALLAPSKNPRPGLRENILTAVAAARPPVALAPLGDEKFGATSAPVTPRSSPLPFVATMAIAACAMAAALFLGLQFKFASDQLSGVRSDFKKAATANEDLRKEVENASSELVKARVENERQTSIAAAAIKDKEEITSMLRGSMEKLSAAEKRADLAQMKVVTLTSKLQADYVASIAWDEQNQSGVLRVTRLPENAADKAYQLWVIDADTEMPVSAGVFRLGADGTARVSFSPVTPVRKAAVFAVSLEKAGGSTSAGPEGEIVIAGAQVD